MKKLALIVITVLIIFYSNKITAQTTTASGYTITGIVKGIDNVYIKLREEGIRDRSEIKTLDSVKITNGKFEFKGKVNLIDMVGLIIDDLYFGRIILENSPISVEIDVTNLNKSNPYFVPVVRGSKSHDQYAAVDAKVKAVFKNPKYKPLDALREMYMTAKKTKDPSDMDKANAKQKKLIPLSEERINTMTKIKYDFVRNNPSSPVAVHVLGYQYTEGRMTKDELKEFYHLFKGDARETNFFKHHITKVYKDNFENLGIGNIAPDFTLKTVNNKELTLSKVEGKYLLVDFWASWCIPCRASFPHLKELRKQYGTEGFTIVGIGTADKEDKWRKAIEEDQTPWLHVFDKNEKGKQMYGPVAISYSVPHLPTTFLVDRDLKIILRNPSKEELDTKLKELFGH
ncbi:TlpA disulfide reductase family protein [Cellulophaga baltica]|uniref:TlpA disulfide reductase family protein n=1 Tax=Cellulophaga baltica TaxID=76594 RepID=UPI00041A3890|nr:TlpA disulfide reductase family protein [Cellulophaga baltica]